MRTYTTIALFTLTALTGAACSSDDASPYPVSGWSSPDAGNASLPDVVEGTDSGPGWVPPTPEPDTGPPPPPPPENEVAVDLQTPEAGETRLYVPSGGLDSVVVVDVSSALPQVSLVDAGSRPIALRALPDDGGAVVLNALSDDVTVLTPTHAANGEGGGFQAQTLEVVPHHNRLELSPDGTWAFAWHDVALAAQQGDPAGSLNDVSAIRLKGAGAPQVHNLAICLRPTALSFTEPVDTAQQPVAVFHCDNGLSGVDLEAIPTNDPDGGDVFVPPVPVHDDPFIQPFDREVAVAPGGRYAVVRELDRKEVTLVDLQANERHVLALPDFPSDLDLTPDGAVAVVPLPNSQQVLTLEVPEAWLHADMTVTNNPHATVAPTGHAFGSVLLTGDGARGLLYTTQPGTLAVGLLHVDTGQAFMKPVSKEIAQAAIGPDGARAVLFNRQYSGVMAPESTSSAYTIIDLATGYEYLELTQADPTEVVFAPDGSVYVLLPDPSGGQHEVHRVVEFAVDIYPTPAAPAFVGVMEAAGVAAVMLDDPTGWLTLIELATGELDQLNSFELNGLID